MTGGPLAVLVQGLWWWVSTMTGSMSLVGGFGLELSPRWNTCGKTEVFFEQLSGLVVNRAFYLGLSAVLLAGTILVYKLKRRGFGISMEVYGAIGRVNLRHNLGIHVLIAVGLLAVSPLFMGIANLDTAQSAQVLEMYVALIGIILLVPLFWPDQDSNIRDLIYSKAVPAAAHQLVRLLEAFAILAALTGIFVLVMIKGGCSFPAGEYYLGTLAEAVFLGAWECLPTDLRMCWLSDIWFLWCTIWQTLPETGIWGNFICSA